MFPKRFFTLLFISIISIPPVSATLHTGLANGTVIVYDENTDQGTTISPSSFNALSITSILFFQPEDDEEYLLVIETDHGAQVINLLISYQRNEDEDDEDHPGIFVVAMCN